MERVFHNLQVGIEPMQVDAQPEENDNVEEDRYVVENTTLVTADI